MLLVSYELSHSSNFSRYVLVSIGIAPVESSQYYIL